MSTPHQTEDDPASRSVWQRGWGLARRIMRSGGRRLRRRLGLPRPKLRYEDWIRDRLAARLVEYPLDSPTVSFSILTPIADPPARFLRALARSVLDQDYDDDAQFEWVIVDNGCRRAAVRRLLRRLAKHRRVRLIDAERNLGILGGMRLALEHATGDYAVPVDHDDLLYPDALRVLAHFIQAQNEPALLYSDEDKLLRGQPACPFFKPAWDPALFLNCCYVTHLTAFARELALELDVYTDPDAEGCPDWDLYCRFLRAGRTPVHVPEVLYSWRVHGRSTSSIEAGAKSYAVQCQEKVLAKHVAFLDPKRRTEVQSNPLFGHAGMWWPRRRRGGEPALQVHLASSGDVAAAKEALGTLANCGYPNLCVHVSGPLPPGAASSLCDSLASQDLMIEPWLGRHSAWLSGAAAALPEHQLIVTWRDDYLPPQSDWPWEVVGLFERHDDVVAVCGQFLKPDGRVERAGEMFGYGGLAGSPVIEPHFDASGYYGFRFCQRTVSAVTPMFFVARAGFLAEALRAAPMAPSWELLGLWLGAHARRTERRVVYTPHLVCRRQPHVPWPESWADEETLGFLQQHGDLLIGDPFYSRFLSLKDGEGYLLGTEAERRRVLAPVFARLVGASTGAQKRERIQSLAERPAAAVPA